MTILTSLTPTTSSGIPRPPSDLIICYKDFQNSEKPFWIITTKAHRLKMTEASFTQSRAGSHPGAAFLVFLSGGVERTVLISPGNDM